MRTMLTAMLLVAVTLLVGGMSVAEDGVEKTKTDARVAMINFVQESVNNLIHVSDADPLDPDSDEPLESFLKATRELITLEKDMVFVIPDADERAKIWCDAFAYGIDSITATQTAKLLGRLRIYEDGLIKIMRSVLRQYVEEILRDGEDLLDFYSLILGEIALKSLARLRRGSLELAVHEWLEILREIVKDLGTKDKRLVVNSPNLKYLIEQRKEFLKSVQ